MLITVLYNTVLSMPLVSNEHDTFVIGDSNLELHGIERYEAYHSISNDKRSKREISSHLYEIIAHFKANAESEHFCSWMDGTSNGNCKFIYKHAMQAVHASTTLADLNTFAKTYPGRITRAVADTPDEIDGNAAGRAVSRQQFNLDNIDVFANDNRYSYPEHGGAGITVYVLDTGIDCNHEEFRGPDGSVRCSLEKSYFDGDTQGTDNNGHGTHCAGTVAGRTVGVAPRANVVSYKICERCDKRNGASPRCDSTKDPDDAPCNYGLRAMDDIIAKQKAATNPKLVVVSYSVSQDPEVDEEWLETLQNARDNGILFVHAAGNSNQIVRNAQSTFPSAITVAAASYKDKKTKYWYWTPEKGTNYGENVDIWAYGENVYSSLPDLAGNAQNPSRKYGTKTGTSMACPAVAGAVALTLATAYERDQQSISPERIKKQILDWAAVGKIDVRGRPGTTDRFLRIYNFGMAGTYFFPKDGVPESKVVIEPAYRAYRAPDGFDLLRYTFYETVTSQPIGCDIAYSSLFDTPLGVIEDPPASDSLIFGGDKCAELLLKSSTPQITFDYGTKRLSGNALSLTAQNGKTYYKQCREAGEFCYSATECKTTCCNERATLVNICTQSDPKKEKGCFDSWECSDTCEAVGWECRGNEQVCKKKCCSGDVKKVPGDNENLFVCIDSDVGVG